MKLWFDTCYFWGEDVFTVFGIRFARHDKRHKWKGWTLSIVLFHRLINLTYVNNFAAYTERMNLRLGRKK